MLIAAFPTRDIPKATTAIYYEKLKVYPLELLNAAVLDVIGESKYFPSIAEIRARLKEIQYERNCLERGLDPDYGLPVWNVTKEG